MSEVMWPSGTKLKAIDGECRFVWDWFTVRGYQDRADEGLISVWDSVGDIKYLSMRVPRGAGFGKKRVLNRHPLAIIERRTEHGIECYTHDGEELYFYRDEKFQIRAKI